MSNLLLVFFGMFAGVTTVLFGFGGGFLIVPVLYRLLTLNPDVDDPAVASAMHIAVATSTCVMIVNSLMATYTAVKRGALLRSFIWPLGGFIGLGAIGGALCAEVVGGEVLRWAFVIYLGITIIDCVVSAGFIRGVLTPTPRPLGKGSTVGAGLGIGAIATLLGVGGSVMTVPLLRRRGLTMVQATAMANPLSLPVALVGTGLYALLAEARGVDLGSAYLGYVNVTAFLLLAGGAVVGMKVAAPWKARIPDSVHAVVYVALLFTVMGSMAVI